MRCIPAGILSDDEAFIPAGYLGLVGMTLPMVVLIGNAFGSMILSSKFPVVNRQYIAFLNELVNNGQEEDALKWVLRERTSQMVSWVQ